MGNGGVRTTTFQIQRWFWQGFPLKSTITNRIEDIVVLMCGTFEVRSSLSHLWGHRNVPTRGTVPQIYDYDKVLTACEIDFNTWTECGSAVIGRFLLIFYFENIWYFIIVIIRIIFIANIVFIIVSKSAIEAVCTPWYYRILLPMTSVALKINILPMTQNLWVIPHSIEEGWN